MKLMIKIILAFLMLGAFALTPILSQAQFFVMDNPLVNQKIPDFTLNNTKGAKVNLAQYRDNQPTIVFFWATWCPHCREQIKELNKNKDKISGQGIKILLVDVGEDAAQVNKYVSKNNLALDIVLDQEQKVSEDYGLIGVPTFFFVDKNGTIKAVEHVLPEKYAELLNSK
jgi:peroxiredoxin